MSRPLRIEHEGAWYHVMNRGTARAAIFETDDHRMTFIGLFADLQKRFNIEVHAYCLMDNHYHLLLHTPRGNLSRGMRHLNGLFTQYMNRLMNRDGALFRGRYKSILVEDNSYLMHVSRYIHLNPIGPGLSDVPDTYHWSSARYYTQPIVPATGVHTEKVLSMFGDDTETQKQRYKDYLNQGLDKQTVEFYSKQRLTPVMGSEAFVEKHKHALPPSPEITDAKLIGKQATVEEIQTLVASVCGMSIGELLASKRGGAPNIARAVAMYYCQQQGYTQMAIAALFEVNTYHAVSAAIRRLDLNDAAVKSIMERVECRMSRFDT